MARLLIILSILVASLVGCRSANDSASAPAGKSTGASAAAAAATSGEAKTASASADATAPSAILGAPADEFRNKTAEPIAKNFTPPFPDRNDLFEPPRKSAGVARRDEEHGETVELKGFVNVNGQQVVLAIDGVILPIPEGGEKYGVQVISIKPPTVVLQRGRSRWTASLD